MDSSKTKDVPVENELKEVNLYQRESPENGAISLTTEDGTFDQRGNPAFKEHTGGWTTAILLLVNFGLANLAFFGVGVNLVLFLTRVMQQENSVAANNVSKWTGTVYIFSLIGAFMSDSYWGRYLTCAIFQVIYVLGLMLLSLTSWSLLVKPVGCGDGIVNCSPVSTSGTAFFYISIYLIAFGNGGYMPSIATLGSEQFDENDPSERRSKVTFFSYFYFALNAGSLFSNTLLVYFEDSGHWTLGFWISAGAAAAALLLFLFGTPQYRHFKPCGNPLPRIAQVFIAATRKWNVMASNAREQHLYEVEGKESAIAGTRKIPHSNKFKFLDKAATITDEDYCAVTRNHDPWKLCTVTQVEEVKCVLKMLPVWILTIIYSVVFTQMASLFVEQGAVMDSTINGDFHVPPASMSIFDLLSVLSFIFIYRRALIPTIRKFTGNPNGLSELQRMGVGLVFGMLAMVAAGILELERLKRVTDSNKPSLLSIFWQIPQYSLIGISEVFMCVGQLEFFSGQAPHGIKSFGSCLFMASMSLGNYVSSMLVCLVENITKGESSPGWIPGNLNYGHLDRFFFLLAALTAIDLSVYMVFAKGYKYIRLEDYGPEKGEEELTISKV